MIKRILFSFILLFMSASVYASAPLTKYWLGAFGSNVFYDDPTKLANDYLDLLRKNNAGVWLYNFVSMGSGNGSFNYTRCDPAKPTNCSNQVQNLNTISVCSDGSAPKTGFPLAQQCPDVPPPCKAGDTSAVTQNYGTDFQKAVDTRYPTCSSGCSVSTKSLDACWKGITTGNYRCDFTVSNTGGTCSNADAITAQPRPGPEEATPITSAPQKADNAVGCPKGTTQAGMSSDGVPLCVGTGTNPSTGTSSMSKTGPEQVTNNPDGSTVKTQATDVTNSDGSVTTTTKTTTTAADGTVTVKVTSSTGNTPSGAAGKPVTNGADGKDAKNICQTNPELTMCKNSTVSGDCDAGYSCTGDAIQCATMQAARAMQCKQKKDEDELKASSFYSTGKAIAEGNDPLKSSLPGVGNAEIVQMKTPEASGWLGGGSYFKDKTIDLGDGHSLVLPLSKAENLMLALRYVTMIVASLVCFKIIRGTFAGSGV